eukprot:4427706-Pyramimonas_sp.AAC.1
MALGPPLLRRSLRPQTLFRCGGKGTCQNFASLGPPPQVVRTRPAPGVRSATLEPGALPKCAVGI